MRSDIQLRGIFLRNRWRFAIAVAMAAGGSACAPAHAATITAGTYNLLPNTPGQQITISVSGSDQVLAETFYAQIGDGGTYNSGTNTAPVFSGGDIITGTIFGGDNSGQIVDPMQATHPLIYYASTDTSSGTVGDNGKLATLTIDTTNVFTGVFSLDLNGVGAHVPGGPFETILSDSNSQPIPTTYINGSIVITPAPEPASLSLLGFGGLLLMRRVRRQR